MPAYRSSTARVFARTSWRPLFALTAIALFPLSASATPTVTQAEDLAVTPVAAATVFNDSSAGAGKALTLWGNSAIAANVNATVGKITLRMRGDQCGDVSPQALVTVDGAAVSTVTVSATAWTDYSLEVNDADLAGAHVIGVRFANDLYQAGVCDRNLRIDQISTASRPSVNSLSPASGSTVGGTMVTINGADFTSDTSVKFGAANAPVQFLSSTQLKATAPASSAGVTGVVVTTPVGATTAGSFTYVSPTPSVNSLSPASGSTVGGTVVTINGQNFAAGAVVKFGGVNASSTSVVSSSQLTAVAPARAAGAVNVTVSTAEGTSTNAASFTYVAPAGKLLFAPNYSYESLFMEKFGWSDEQEAADNRMQTLLGSKVPGSGVYKPAAAMRTIIQAGDLTTTGIYNRPRSEVAWTPTKFNKGDTVWTSWAFRFAAEADDSNFSAFPFSDSIEGKGYWGDIWQWKGATGASPPVAIGLDTNGHMHIDGSAAVFSQDLDLGQFVVGRWYKITMGVRFEPNNTGWVEVSIDDKSVPLGVSGGAKTTRFYRPTLETITRDDGTKYVDSVYAKQGLYQADGWKYKDRLLYHSAPKIGTTKDIVQ
jgi:Ca-dependent carbohydrate-binding module xylan-binding/Polysaccharide lyase/IPT/TIG domain